MLNGDTSAGGAGNDDTDPDPPLANTTLHGLNHVVQQGPRARRLCWAVLLLLAMAGITWLLTDKIATFKSAWQGCAHRWSVGDGRAYSGLFAGVCVCSTRQSTRRKQQRHESLG